MINALSQYATHKYLREGSRRAFDSSKCFHCFMNQLTGHGGMLLMPLLTEPKGWCIMDTSHGFSKEMSLAMDADYKFFIDNLEDLYRRYGRRALAIKNRCILGVYDTIQSAFAATVKTETLGTFIIQECAPTREELIVSFAGNVY